MNNIKKILIRILALLGIIGLVYYVSWIIMSFTPTDIEILRVLEKNEQELLNINGVVGAGIARNEFNHIIGIAIYVKDTADVQKIPKKLGEFDVFVRKKDEKPEWEKKNLLYMNLRE